VWNMSLSREFAEKRKIKRNLGVRAGPIRIDKQESTPGSMQFLV